MSDKIENPIEVCTRIVDKCDDFKVIIVSENKLCILATFYNGGDVREYSIHISGLMDKRFCYDTSLDSYLNWFLCSEISLTDDINDIVLVKTKLKNEDFLRYVLKKQQSELRNLKHEKIKKSINTLESLIGEL